MLALSACTRDPRAVDLYRADDAPTIGTTNTTAVPAPEGGSPHCCHGMDADGRCYGAGRSPAWPKDVPRCDSPAWKQLSKNLRDLINREANRTQDRSPPQWMEESTRCFAEDFERCHVRFRQRESYLLVHVPFGGLWVGARLNKKSGRWTVLQLDSGDIR
jgi:hypothetical protein